MRKVLEEAFGATALGNLHRLTEDGPCNVSLPDELTAIEQLLDGAAATARRELGMGLRPSDAATSRSFAVWQGEMATDPDISRDARMMVPVYYDLQREKTKVWVFLGWRLAQADVSYWNEPRVLAIQPVQPPEPEPTNRLGILNRIFRKVLVKPAYDPPKVLFERALYAFAVPVMAEVYVSQLLDRDEFRKHCDRFRTRDAILANLR